MAKQVINPFAANAEPLTVVSRDPWVKPSELVGKAITINAIKSQKSYRFGREEYVLSIKLGNDSRRVSFAKGSPSRDQQLEQAMLAMASQQGLTFDVTVTKSEKGSYRLVAAG